MFVLTLFPLDILIIFCSWRLPSLESSLWKTQSLISDHDLSPATKALARVSVMAMQLINVASLYNMDHFWKLLDFMLKLSSLLLPFVYWLTSTPSLLFICSSSLGCELFIRQMPFIVYCYFLLFFGHLLREGFKKNYEKAVRLTAWGGVTPSQPDRFYLWKCWPILSYIKRQNNPKYGNLSRNVHIH